MIATHFEFVIHDSQAIVEMRGKSPECILFGLLY